MKTVLVSLVALVVCGVVCLSLLLKGNADRDTQRAVGRPTPNGWTVRSLGTGLELRDVQFLDEETGWGLTSDGVWHTIDGGQNWTEVRKSPSETLSVMPNYHPQMLPEHIQFLNTTEGWVVEQDYLIHTTDGGGSWEKRLFENTVITSCFFLDRNHGWCVGQVMRLPKKKRDAETRHKVIYSTRDGGGSWRLCYEEAASDPYPLHDVWANSMDDIWAVSDLLHSTDSGETWQKVEISNWEGVGGGPVSIRFLDKSVGWITTNGPGGYLYTGDGGKTWESRPAPEGFNGAASRSIVYGDRDQAWAIGRGGLYHSANSGRSWTKVLEGEYDGVAFLKDKGVIIAAGRDVAMRRTDNPR